MTTIELKNILIQKISAINDKSFLNAIKTIIDTKSDSVVFRTSEEQKKAILEGIQQIENGEIFTNEQVGSEISKWLEEK
ncbi:MAG TPA: hypothetical protein VF985_02715 [Mariniflexile sp.]|jgi:predicted transcriptional regulator